MESNFRVSSNRNPVLARIPLILLQPTLSSHRLFYSPYRRTKRKIRVERDAIEGREKERNDKTRRWMENCVYIRRVYIRGAISWSRCRGFSLKFHRAREAARGRASWRESVDRNASNIGCVRRTARENRRRRSRGKSRKIAEARARWKTARRWKTTIQPK